MLDANNWYPAPPVTGTTAWRCYAYRFRTPAAPMKNPYVRFRLWNATGTAWYDGISLRRKE